MNIKHHNSKDFHPKINDFDANYDGSNTLNVQSPNEVNRHRDINNQNNYKNSFPEINQDILDVANEEISGCRDDLIFKNSNEIDLYTELQNVGEFMSNIPEQNCNFEKSEMQNKKPDVNILIDMDVVTKNAVFIVEMPESWNTKIYSRFKSDDNLVKSELREIELYKADDEANIDANISKRSDKLNVGIEMLLCKENLDESEIIANLNTKTVRVKRLSKSDITSESAYEESDDDLAKEQSNYNIKQLPEQVIEERVERQRFQFESDSFREPSKRFDFRYKFPEMSFSSRSRNKSMNYIEDLNDDNNKQRYDFRFQLPKVEWSSICFKKDATDSVFEMNDDFHSQTKTKPSMSDPEIHSQSGLFDFKKKFPNFNFPSFTSRRKSSRSKTNSPNVESHPKRYFLKYHFPLFGSKEKSPANDDENVESKVAPIEQESPKRFDFKYQLPKLKLPEFIIPKKSSVENENEEIENHTERYDFRYQLPKVKLPSFGSKEKSPVIEEHVYSHDFVEQENNPKRFDFRYQLPKIEIPLIGSKEKSPDVDRDVSFKDNLNCPEETLEQEGDSHRFDFRFQFPKIEIPLFSSKVNSPNVEEEIESLQYTVPETEDSPKRFDFRYQLPKIELPEITILRRSSTVDRDEENKAASYPERFDFRFQLPKVELPLFSSADKSPTENNATNGDAETLDTETSPKRFDFRYQLPKIDFPSFNMNERIPQSSVCAESVPTDPPVGSLKFPTIDFSSLFFKEKPPPHEPGLHFDVNSDAHLKSLIDDFDTNEVEANRSKLFKNRSVNLSRKISNHFALLYLDNIESKRRGSLPEVASPDSHTLQSTPLRRNWTQIASNNVPQNRLNLTSIGEQLQSAFSKPTFANPNIFSGDQYSDIDIHPSPSRIIHLPHFSPLLSINAVSNYKSSESDVGSILAVPRKGSINASDNLRSNLANRQMTISH